MKLPFKLLLLSLLLVGSSRTGSAADPVYRFVTEDRQLKMLVDGQEVVHYVFADREISRPYFSHVKTLEGKQVSRNHPPQQGTDKMDHANMHPGIWLSFGDLNGHDYWRLKAKTQHVRFLELPKVDEAHGSFKVLNHYFATDSDAVICSEECTIGLRKVNNGYSISITSEFKPVTDEVRFGDQEEMGLGIRVATPLAVEKKLGGRIRDSEGRLNGEEVWGKTARWCDYSGPLDGKWVGMTVLTSPRNFRPCWSHARDYGFVALNPFGLNAFTKAAKVDVTVKKGESLRLGYAVIVHESAQESDFSPQTAYEQFVTQE